MPSFKEWVLITRMDSEKVRKQNVFSSIFFLSRFTGNEHNAIILIKCVAKHGQNSALGKEHEEKLERKCGVMMILVCQELNCFFLFLDMKRSVLEIKNQNESIFKQCYGLLGRMDVIILSGSCLPLFTVLLL